VILRRRGWLNPDRAAARRLTCIVLATTLMAAVIFTVHGLLAPSFQTGGSVFRLAMLVLLVAVGLAAYLASLTALGVTSPRSLVAIVRASNSEAGNPTQDR
jgi:peptidoglycan biosynthesis protein MviN/MurJ (putative lipid II flippase)